MCVCGGVVGEGVVHRLQGKSITGFPHFEWWNLTLVRPIIMINNDSLLCLLLYSSSFSPFSV